MFPIKRGDLVYVNFGHEQVGSEQWGIRPAIVIQNNIGNRNSTTTIVVPLTTAIKKINMPTHVQIRESAKKHSVAMAEQLRVVDRTRIVNKIGEITADEMQKLELAIIIEFNIDPRMHIDFFNTISK